MHKELCVDWEKCTGCRLCEMACSISHEGECNPRLSRIRIITFPGHGASFPSTCARCSVPVCQETCPVGAISPSRDTGMPVVDTSRCIGCKECVVHCPLDAVTIHPATGRAMKCDLCDGDPACVKFCSHGALSYEYGEVYSMTQRRAHIKVQLSKVGAQ